MKTIANQLGFTARATVTLTVAVLVFAAVSLVAYRPAMEARAHAQCKRSLNALGAALKQYAATSHGERFPPLSPVSGHLTFAVELVAVTDDEGQGPTVKAALSDKYWYLGWAIANERSGLEWIEQYRKHAPDIGSIPVQTGVWPDCERDIAARQQPLDAEWYRDHPDGRPLPGDGPKAGRPMAQPELEEMRFYYPLKEGVERFLITEIGNPAAPARVQSLIPVLIERPELHRDGGHVLYMDGHVEFVKYPGEFPMTRRFIEGVRSLDALENQE